MNCALACSAAYAAILREELAAAGVSLPVYAELAPPHATPDRIVCWADGVEEIVPKQCNYKLTCTVAAELDSATHSDADASALFAAAMAAVERAFGRCGKGAQLDAYGCAATVLDCICTPQPAEYADGRWRCAAGARIYLQF